MGALHSTVLALLLRPRRLFPSVVIVVYLERHSLLKFTNVISVASLAAS